MAKFNAAKAVDPLEYDFRPYADAHGTVPEPSDEQVEAFYAGLGTTLQDALGEDRVEGVDLRDPQQLGRLMAELTKDDYRKMSEALLTLHAGVCSDSPSQDELEALPYRLKQAFYGMLQGWLRPEGSRPAGNV